jgi:hypothetical protein
LPDVSKYSNCNAATGMFSTSPVTTTQSRIYERGFHIVKRIIGLGIRTIIYSQSKLVGNHSVKLMLNVKNCKKYFWMNTVLW